jgi:hypothetical protein
MPGFVPSTDGAPTDFFPTDGPVSPSLAPPVSLVASSGNHAVGLTWPAASGAATYNVYRGTTTGGESGTPIATGVTVTVYSDTGLTNGTEYFYKVASVSGGTTSAKSPEASATPRSRPHWFHGLSYRHHRRHRRTR